LKHSVPVPPQPSSSSPPPPPLLTSVLPAYFYRMYSRLHFVPMVLQKRIFENCSCEISVQAGCTSGHPTNQQRQNTEDDNCDNGFQISRSAHPPLLLRLMPLAVRHSTHAQSVTTPLIGGDTLRIR